MEDMLMLPIFPLRCLGASMLAFAAFTCAHATEIETYSCRNGYFPSENKELELARVHGAEGSRIDLFVDEKGCPADTEACSDKAYLVPGDEVIVNKRQNGWACVWYQGRRHETVRWIRAEKLATVKVPTPLLADWVGTWRFGTNWIRISKVPNGALRVTGEATYGSGPRINVGDLQGEIEPRSERASMGKDERFCVVDFVRVGRFLVASDNANCGGANVRFDGVYVRRK
ncbi:hypothetical protein [Cupriavidus basilensis]|uniref:hypothetical protein n=1 Tax=Cupriavidus basilensis TaxID=68895 RepID=UPI0020A6244F|nr:hypothetical protein [Cupriavidus basilensis]MCP3025222.1 hypothetical protein [Cupriavidus basilensis]